MLQALDKMVGEWKNILLQIVPYRETGTGPSKPSIIHVDYMPLVKACMGCVHQPPRPVGMA